MIEVNCDDKPFTFDFRHYYWLMVIVFLVWVPTLTMAVCYGLILYRLKQSTRRFPYLSGANESTFSMYVRGTKSLSRPLF